MPEEIDKDACLFGQGLLRFTKCPLFLACQHCMNKSNVHKALYNTVQRNIKTHDIISQ